MSIATKTGDKGETRLMYSRKVLKSHPRVAAYGTVDELTSALGMVRALGREVDLVKPLRGVQEDLVHLMGELATLPEDLARFEKDGFQLITPSFTAKLDALVEDLEKRDLKFTGWAIPGDTPVSAALDLARTTCRRAERQVCSLQETGQLSNDEIIIYLNRLSDVLWLMARGIEQGV